MPLTLATIAPGEPEIFASIQGEGVSAGRPSVFLRLSRCNLACIWCDTAYTWHFVGDNRPHRDGTVFERSANQLTLTEEEVAGRVSALGMNRLVITGGEPLLQAPALARMIEELPPMHIEVETNGTVLPSPTFDVLVHQYNVSPKLAHSGNPTDLALPPDRLAHWAAEPRAWFKFVIAELGDLSEVLAIAQDYDIAPSKIFLMPEGRDSESIRARSLWLVQACADYGFNFTDRLHIHLFGDTRGS